MKTTAALLAGGLAALMAASVSAHDDMGKDDHHAEHNERMEAWLNGIDTNNDGYINADEAETARHAMFQRQDADGDGRVTREEMRSFIESYHRDRPGGADSERMIDRMFERPDQDNDGVVTEQEYTVTSQQRFERMEERHEKHHD